jgi:bifunctional DNA-binding transcriptional regulator/antitoxin component of YhaV-PrlF toxin-antitoxin module
VTITIQKDGTLKLPTEILERLGTNEVEITVQGKTILLEPQHPKRIRDLETPEERASAFKALLQRIQHPGNPNLPDWHELRDEMYD